MQISGLTRGDFPMTDNALINRFCQARRYVGAGRRPAAYGDQSSTTGHRTRTSSNQAITSSIDSPAPSDGGGAARSNRSAIIPPELLTTEYTEGAEVSRFSIIV